MIVLFGIMNVGAFIGFIEDMAHRRKTLTQVMTPSMGFKEIDGAWTWRLEQAPLAAAVGAPAGSAVAIAGVLGFPFIRLRAALPEELLPGSVAQSLGRQAGLSISGMAQSQAQSEAVLSRLSRSASCAGPCRCADAADRIPELQLEQDTPRSPAVREAKPPHPRFDELLDYYDCKFSALQFEAFDLLPGSEKPRAERMVGTALMFAHLANQRAMPLTLLSARRGAASAYFGGVRLPGIDHDFDALCAIFMLMLCSDEAGSLTQRAKWLRTARLWRLVLLQRSDGAWELSESLAFALEAHAGPLPPADKKARRGGLMSKLQLLIDPPDDLDDLFDGPEQDTLVDDDAPREGHSVDDCPLTFSRAAMLRRMPPALLKAVPNAAQRERLWATVLAVVALEKSDASWLISDEDEDERTLVDAGRDFIYAKCEDNKRLRKMVASGALYDAADKALRRWKASTEYAIELARYADAVAQQNVVAHVQRAGSRVIKSIMTDHDTFSTFLDADGFIQRWQARIHERLCTHADWPTDARTRPHLSSAS